MTKKLQITIFIFFIKKMEAFAPCGLVQFDNSNNRLDEAKADTQRKTRKVYSDCVYTRTVLVVIIDINRLLKL